MRIAVVINTSWNIYNFRMGLVQALLNAGHEVWAIAPPDEYSAKIEEAGCRYYPVALDRKGVHPFNDLKYTYNLFKIYREIHPDAVLHYTIKPNIYGTAAARLLGIPVINNVSGLGTVFLSGRKNLFIAQWLYRFAFRFPKKVFFQNPDDQHLFVNRKLVKPQITDVLPGSGIDPEKFAPGPFARNPVFTFLLIARLLYDKGIVEYIEAIKLLRAKGIPAHFELMGFIDPGPSGIPEAQLRQWIDEDLVTYLGTTSDVRPAIQRADCIVLPSYREGTPRTLLEAACLAKPIIATRVPGCVEVVQDEVNGFLCEAKNPADLASRMERIIALDDQALQRMGEASRELVLSKFDEKFVIKKYFDALT
jgi:glycosyltransferase involved in cell wall biosynthesis